MLKRFYSKRSGFTLVEIIIAFAVFAIMASMICQLLNLSVRARQYNNKYQLELESQQRRLNLIEKSSDDFKETQGTIHLEFANGTVVDLPYDRFSAMLDSDFDGEGLNYFISNVDYQSDGEFSPGGNLGGSNGGTGSSNTGSQMSRMDTRITGTGGIAGITIGNVIKDTHTYAANDPFAIPEGHTRYFIECIASAGADPQTLMDEDIPYSQYRLYFYHMPDPAKPNDDSYLDKAASNVVYEEDGKKYTKDVNKVAVIKDLGYLQDYSAFTNAVNNGLKSAYTMSKVGTNNRYTIEQMGTNVVRIGTPYTSGTNGDPERGTEGKGVKFGLSSSLFYIEFEGDPHLTVDSFGYNALVRNGAATYKACPTYTDDYDSDGKPLYYDNGEHVNIYGAYLQPRHYK